MFSPLTKFAAVLLSLAPAIVSGAELTQVQDFGENPTDVDMYIYVPDTLAENPPILVAIHYCTGTAQAYYSGTQYARLADENGYIVIYPEAPDPGGCWDVHTDETLTHDAGGDSLGIVSMVRYTLEEYSADASRVFMVGISSGAMMVNVLAGAYPDIFAAGAASAGVPYGCFQGPDMWNSECSSGKLQLTAEEWGARALSGYPGYSGDRPRLQLWHGTQDETLNYQNFLEALKQWSNVLGLESTAENADTPEPGYTEMVYGDGTQLVGYSAEGVSHSIPEHGEEILAFLGLI